jgi:hypothetical protein
LKAATSFTTADSDLLYSFTQPPLHSILLYYFTQPPLHSILLYSFTNSHCSLLYDDEIALLNDDGLNLLTVTVHGTLLTMKLLFKMYAMRKNERRIVFLKDS